MKASHRAGSCLFAALASVLGATALASPEPSGIAVAVIQSADVDSATGKLVIQPQGPLYSGDRINTGAIGEVQVRFRDDTKLVVGPNSSMVIDAFVFNDNSTARQVSINAVKGAFRFITGNSVKDAYTIATPTATIGVRGTAFDVSVDPQDGTTYLAQLEGKTIICPRRGNENVDKKKRKGCVVTAAGCAIFVIGRDKDPKKLESAADRNLAIRRNFRYVRNQRSLLAGFRLDVSACGANQLPLIPFFPPPQISP